MTRAWPRALAIAVVVAAALWLRGSTIGARGLWLDEFATGYLTRGASLSELWHRCDGHARGPVFYALVRVTTWLLGESEVTLRLPSLLLGALLPLLVYLGTARSLGVRPAGVAALLVALEPELVWHGQQARSYTLGEACVGVALVALGRAVATGRPAPRALLWTSAAVALDAHATFVPLLAAVALAPLAVPRARRVYPWARLWRDACCCAAAVTAFALHAAQAARSRGINVWTNETPRGFLEVLFSLPALGILAIAGVGVLRQHVVGKSALASSWRAWSTERRAAVGFVVVGFGASAALWGMLAAAGSPLGVSRYLGVAVIAGQILVAVAIASLPRPVGALALLLVVGAQIEDRSRRGNFGQEWREAQAQLEALRPSPGEPVLLWTGLGESDLVPFPAAISGVTRAIMESPLEVTPGRAPPGRHYFLLTRRWNVEGQPRYFEQDLVPLLERSGRFDVVAHPDYAALLERWVAARLPHRRFRCTFRSREFVAPIVVLRYESEAAK